MYLSFSGFLSDPTNKNYKATILCPDELKKDSDSLEYAQAIQHFIATTKFYNEIVNGTISSDKLISLIKKNVSVAPIITQINNRFDFIDPEDEKDAQEAQKIFYEKVRELLIFIKKLYQGYQQYCLQKKVI